MEPPRTISTTTAAATTITTTSSRRYRCVQTLTFTFVLLFLILMAVIAIAWFVLNPQEPNFRVTSLSVSNFAVSEWELRGMYDMGFGISNPNKKVEILVENLEVVVYYDGVELCWGRMEGSVEVGKMKEKNVKVETQLGVLKGSRKSKNKREKVIGVVEEEWKKGVVNFNIRMEVRIRYEYGNLPSRLKVFGVYCEDLDVAFFSSKHTGKLLGVGNDCRH